MERIEAKQAYGRLLLQDLKSPINIPDRIRSHMDGYAVSISDLKAVSAKNPRILSLVGESDLTDDRRRRILSGQTIGIATGGELPVGADAVVPVENAERIGDTVRFSNNVRKGEHCFPIGVDVKKGSIAIRARVPIRAQDVGMLALLGIRKVQVFAKPRVAIIATGSELVDAFKVHNTEGVRESHSPILENLIREIGGVVTSREIVGDSISHVTKSLTRALRKSDIVLILGGTSLGHGDIVEPALRQISKQTRIIHGIKMDRGRVAGVAAIDQKPVVMIPGPVQGAINAFFLLALPFITRMSGANRTGHVLNAHLSKNWKARNRFRDFTKVLYVRLERSRNRILAEPIVGETESISVLTQSDGFVVVTETIKEIGVGDEVSVTLLPGFSYVGGYFPGTKPAMFL